MPPIQNTSGISFTVETLLIRDGRKLGRLRANQDGYYEIPLAVLGTPTRNKTYYDVPDFVNQINSSESMMNKLLVDGNLFGEYGHPDVSDYATDNNRVLSRLMVINERLVSHHIRKIRTGETLESGGVIIYGEVKPTGPYGQALKESLEDPCINTAFSLRSIAQSTPQNGLIYRKIKKLVTFDAVAAGGYAEASKRYSPATESIIADVTITPGTTVIDEVAMERFSNHELNEIFGAKSVMIRGQTRTYLPGTTALVAENGEVRSVFHDLMRR